MTCEDPERTGQADLGLTSETGSGADADVLRAAVFL